MMDLLLFFMIRRFGVKMEIKTVVLGILGVNCYLISGEKGAVVIDPGYESEEITAFLKANQEKERLIILTHNHFDHIGFANSLALETDTKIAIGEIENEGLNDPEINLSVRFAKRMTAPKAEVLLNDGDDLEVGDLKFRVLHTPGHTVGGICLLTDDCIFSGDTLFFESIGRTDFPGGSFDVIESSIKRLYSYDEKLTVYPGHGPETTLGHEKYFNPFVRL